MSMTTRVARERLASYFDSFTKRFLRDGSSEAVDVEVLEPDWGAQYSAQGSRLMGITYDPSANCLEFALDWGDHRVPEPQDVWAMEETDGFVSALEVTRRDGLREVVSVRRVGLRRLV
jgi:uncharacterized protein DUF5335